MNPAYQQHSHNHSFEEAHWSQWSGGGDGGSEEDTEVDEYDEEDAHSKEDEQVEYVTIVNNAGKEDIDEQVDVTIPHVQEGEEEQKDKSSWTDRLAAALSKSTHRRFAAAISTTAAPNPLVQLQLKADIANGSTPSTDSLHPDPIGLGVPLPPTQLNQLLTQGYFRRHERLGFDIIPHEIVSFGNTAWGPWVRIQAQEMVSAYFGIQWVEVTLDAGFVIGGSGLQHSVSGFGKDLQQENPDINRFGKFLVILPAFDEITLTVEGSELACNDSDNSITNSITANQPPGKTLLSFFYNGANPTISLLTQTASALCLLYTVYLPPQETLQGQYQPWQLRIPDETEIITELHTVVKEWKSQFKNGDILEPYLLWVLDRYYRSNCDIEDTDASRRDRLLQVATALGLKVYLVSLNITQECDDPPVGWINPDQVDFMFNYDLDEIEDPDLDENGRYYWDVGADCRETYKLSNFYDLQRGEQIHPSAELGCSLDVDIPFAEPIEFTTKTPGLVQDFEKGDGTLMNYWKRSAMVFWPKEFHVESLLSLFGWGAASLVGSNLHVADTIEEDLAQRTALVGDLLAGDFRSTMDVYVPKHAHSILEFALKQRRADMFHKALVQTGTGRPNPDSDAKLIHDALTLFANNQELIKALVEGYGDTQYWKTLLGSFTQDTNFIHTHLHSMASAHVPSFNLGKLGNTPTDSLIQFVLSFGLRYIDSAAVIFRNILHSPTCIRPDALNGSMSTKCAAILVTIRQLLQQHHLQPTCHPCIPHFFQGMWLKYILPSLPPPPPAASSTVPPDLRLPPHTCHREVQLICGDCQALSRFLCSELDQCSMQMSQARRQHIMSEINTYYPQRRNLRMSEQQPPKRVGTLKVEKVGLSWEDRALAWQKYREWVERELKSLGTDYFVKDAGGVSIWWGRIAEAVSAQPAGSGFTKELERAAGEFLAEEFPVSQPEAIPRSSEVEKEITGQGKAGGIQPGMPGRVEHAHAGTKRKFMEDEGEEVPGEKMEGTRRVRHVEVIDVSDEED